MSQPFLHGGMGVSVEVPSGWSVEGTATFPLQLFAPTQSGYRSNLMFSLEPFEPPTPEGASAFLNRVREEQLDDYPGFEQLDEAETTLDGRPAVVMHYRWSPGERLPEMVQILALVVVEPGLFLQVDGATTAALQAEKIPELDEILRAVRLVPRRPESAASTD